MVEGYRTSVLNRIGKTSAWLEEELADLDSREPFQKGGSVSEHVERYGVAADKEETLRSEYEGLHSRHNFRLELWPEMYWSLYSVDGIVYMCSFTRRDQRRVEAGDIFSSGAWAGAACLPDFEAAGAAWELVDGWGERVLVRITKANGEQLGTFVYALFQGWHQDAEDSWPQ